jgi:hypothetical protein
MLLVVEGDLLIGLQEVLIPICQMRAIDLMADMVAEVLAHIIQIPQQVKMVFQILEVVAVLLVMVDHHTLQATVVRVSSSSHILHK